MSDLLVRLRPEGLSKIPMVGPGQASDITRQVLEKKYLNDPRLRNLDPYDARVLNIPRGARLYQDKGNYFVGFPPDVYLDYAERAPEFGVISTKKKLGTVVMFGAKEGEVASYANSPSMPIVITDKLTARQSKQVAEALRFRNEEIKYYRKLLDSQPRGYVNVPAARVSPQVRNVNPFDWGFQKGVTPKRVPVGYGLNVRLPFATRLANALKKKR